MMDVGPETCKMKYYLGGLGDNFEELEMCLERER